MRMLTIKIWALMALAALPLEAKRPNVLFIAVDDLRPELGCYGTSEIQSPNIDRFAKSGVIFERAYCQLAVCNPSRVSLMTGLRPDSAKVWTLDVRFRDTIPDVVTLPQHFKKHGYYAASFGKIFHNPWPDNVSWSEPHSWPKGAKLWSEDAKKRRADFRKKMRADGLSEAAIKRIRPQATEIVDIEDREHIDGAIAEQALGSMRELAKNDKPFFLAAGFVRPHLPFVVPRKYWDLYDREKISLAPNQALPADAPRFAMNTMYELRDYMDYFRTPHPRSGSLTEAQQRELKHGYYASVSFIDAQIGRLLEELENLGLADDTIVVLWGDHGWKLGEHNSWCKQSNYEIDTRVPMVIRAPGAKGNGRITKSFAELVDLYPTLCELADVPLAKHLEGISVVPLLNDPKAGVKEAAFSQFRRRVGKKDLMGYAMRTDYFRYVEWINRRTGETEAQELYDHRTDPGENTNLARISNHKKRLEKLSEQLWTALPAPPRLAMAEEKKEKRPNIVFFMADDWSWPHAGICGDKTVKTPNFDRVAREGVLFHNAFVSTPSCTPSRTSILTGQHHWRLKEGDSLGGSLREEFDVYTEMLQKSGYRIGRHGKGVWPSKHQFRNRDSFGEQFRTFDDFLETRKGDEPICFWYGGRDPHRPYELGIGAKSGIDLDKIEVPPCLPDVKEVRSDLADYYWCVQRFDREVGQVLARLEKMGELDHTIVVISGDNGMPFPRAKATLYDLGTRVPLAVRWGDKVKGGRVVDDFVSLCDFAPTFLEAGGVPKGKSMTGNSLLPLLFSGESGQVEMDRTHVLTGNEKHCFLYPSRALRNRDFLYIRNFNPGKWKAGEAEGQNPSYDFEKQPWPTGEGAFSYNIDPGPSKQAMRLNRKTPEARLTFAKRSREELYDLKADPDQLRNVAKDKRYAVILEQLRERLAAELQASQDPRSQTK
ncbi:MAG: sulfatase-like hydrolase/transferase [Akkermansiaceae bacterium]